MQPRKPTETEREILDLFSGVNETNPVFRGTLLLISDTEKREHINAISARMPEGISRDYQAGRNAAVIYIRERLEKMVRLANPPPDSGGH